MKFKVLIIVNAVAGKQNIKKYIPYIINNFEELNFQTQIEYTTIENDAYNIIKNYKEYCDVILVCGGDGTLNQVIQGVYETDKRVCIGFVPVGTTNDFAKSLNVSFDKLHISENIYEYRSKKVDIGLIENQIFNYVVAFGIFSKSSYKTSSKLKRRIGKLAYILSGIKDIFNYKTYQLEIQTDTEKIQDEFFYGSISNSKYIGGFNLFKTKSIEFNDGKFEAVFVKKPKNFYQTIKLIFKVLNGNLKDDNIYYLQTSMLKIKCNEPIELSIDGEYGGAKKDITIYVQNQYIEYLVPSNEKQVSVL